MLLERIRKTITRYNMLPMGCRVAVAVSGGPDSVCLLLTLVQLAPEYGVTLRVAHLNHKLRGKASDEDQEFVEQLAARLELPFQCAEGRPRLADGNLEQTARNARYAFFRGLIESNLADRVAVGHTRDDQAETVLFRILRGSGSAGISGVHPVNNGGLIRPLLDTTHAEVVEFLGSHGQDWREDQSNQDARFARNRIRHSLLPELQRDWNPQLTSALAQLADLAFEEERWWHSEMEALLSNLCQPFGGGAEVSAKSVTELPKAVARRFIRALVSQVKSDLQNVDFGHVECVLELAAEQGEERSVHLPGIWITRSCGLLWLRKAGVELNAPPVTHLSSPGTYPAPDGSLVFITDCHDEQPDTAAGLSPHQQANGATLKSAALWLRPVDRMGGSLVGVSLAGTALSGSGEPIQERTARNQIGSQFRGCSLQLRGWRAGDRYRPEGRATEQKMKEMFQRVRVPSWRRPFWPIVTYGDVIVWAKQFGPAAGFAQGFAEDFEGPLIFNRQLGDSKDSVGFFRIWGNERKAAEGGNKLR